jgi:UDP-glucose 4-epimerase
LGREDYCVVNESIGWIIEELKLDPKITYAGGTRGWVGDSPFIQLDTRRIRALGWQPKLTIQEGVLHTLRYLQANPWILEQR